MTAFYNEVDPLAAQWLRNLISAGHIAPGIVDERPIQEIEAFELSGFTQCHFFAGIGVWSYALRQAGWSDDRPIWTGSCPCQPFSNAGTRKGISDERHLWPYWHPLIEQRKPSVVIGEQVASKDGLGWLDLVSTDMEASDYAFGAGDLCAAGFDGAHIRQRLYFVGVEISEGKRGNGSIQSSEWETIPRILATGTISGMGGSDDTGLEGYRRESGKFTLPQGWQGAERHGYSTSTIRGLVDDDSTGSSPGSERPSTTRHGNSDESASSVGGLDNAASARRIGAISGAEGNPRDEARLRMPGEGHGQNQSQPADAPMLGRNAADWLYCRDGKWRPVEPGTFPLAHAAPARVGRLRAYGNALDAETATHFCHTVKEICDGL